MRRASFFVAMMGALLSGPACGIEKSDGTVGKKELELQLFAAISLKDQAKAITLIRAGANPNARQEEGVQLTVLHRAAEYGLIGVVEALIAKGAKLDPQSHFFRGTPLVVALANGHEDIARLLVASGANAAIVDSAGYTPLHVAARSSSTQLLELLLAKRANVNATSKTGDTPLSGAIASERWENAKFLIAKGADIRSDTGEGTALIMAARHGSRELVELLVGKGADVRAKNRSGLTALHYAAVNGHRDVAEYLIDKGADVNAASVVKDGRNVAPPLMGAAYRGRFDVVKLLVIRGANLNFRNRDGGNVVSSAAFGGHREIVEWLVDNGAEVNPFDKDSDVTQGINLPLYAAVYSATFSGNLEMVRFLIAKGANVNAKARNGETALGYAKQHGLKEIIALLVANGAKE